MYLLLLSSVSSHYTTTTYGIAINSQFIVNRLGCKRIRLSIMFTVDFCANTCVTKKAKGISRLFIFYFLKRVRNDYKIRDCFPKSDRRCWRYLSTETIIVFTPSTDGRFLLPIVCGVSRFSTVLEEQKYFNKEIN